MIIQKEEYETARPYQEFVESFQGDNATKSFVRGGTINPSDKHKVDSEGKRLRLFKNSCLPCLVCVRSPLFNFLFEPVSIEHTYYVWRLYSFAFDCLITKYIFDSS